MPEARIVLSQATTYLATTPKSNAAYLAVDSAMNDVAEGRTLSVPMHLRNVKVASVDGKGSGEYVYPHDFKGHVAEQQYMASAKQYYQPSEEGYEETIGRRMAYWKSLRNKETPAT